MMWKWIIAAFILGICAGSSNGEDKKILDEMREELANLKTKMKEQSEEIVRREELENLKTKIKEQSEEIVRLKTEQKAQVERLLNEESSQKLEVQRQRLELEKKKVENDKQRIQNDKLKFNLDAQKVKMDQQKMKLEEVQAKSSEKKMEKRQDGETVVKKVAHRQEDIISATREICVEEIIRYNREHHHNETENLKKLINEEIRRLMPSGKLVEIIYDGTAGASAEYNADYAAKYAFQNAAGYWWNSGTGSGSAKPSFVWFRFRTPHRLAKIGFQGEHNKYAPKSFEVIGSNDCSTWTTMFSTSNSGIPNDMSSTFFSWNIEKRHRLSFSCIGIKSIDLVIEKTGNNPEIKNIIMWEEI